VVFNAILFLYVRLKTSMISCQNLRISASKEYFCRQPILMNQLLIAMSFLKLNQMRIHLSLISLILLLSFQAQSQFRKYSNEFLNIGVGARGLAMGSAQVASVKDGTAGYWNPAGLTGVKDNASANLMHAEYFSGIGKFDYASIAFPMAGNKRTLGITAIRFAVDDIPNTLFLVEPDGTINYNNIKEFSSADYAFLVSLGQTLKQSEKKEYPFWCKCQSHPPQCRNICKSMGFWTGCRITNRI
jgi:hypothetical protein